MNSQDIRNIVLKINDSDVQKKIENLNKRLENSRRIKEQLESKAANGNLTKQETADLAKFTREVNTCERQLKSLRSTKQQVEHALNNLSSAGPKELKNTLRALNKELESGNIKRGTKEWKDYQIAIKEVNSELRKIKEESKQVESFSTRLEKGLSRGANLWMSVQGFVAAYSGLRNVAMDAVNAFAEIEEAQSDVRKYTGMTTEEVKELNEEFKKMDTRTPREKLNALAGDAGRLGLQGKQSILDFVEAADTINIALGEDLGKDAVKNIGKLAQLFGDDQTLGLKQAMLATGSAINELAQNSAASEPYILDFTARLAGIGKQAGISQADIMGFAASLDEGMLRDEMASTAMANLITKMFQDPAKLAKAAGLEVKAFTELIKNDANAALIQYFETMNSKGGFDSLAPMFNEMGLDGSRATQVLANMANQIEKVKEHQLLANKAYREGNSVIQEAAIKNNTVQAQLEKARQRFADIKRELGEKLLPVIQHVISANGFFVKTLNSVISFVAQNWSAISKLIIVLGSLLLVVKSVTIAKAAWKGVTIACTTLLNGLKIAVLAVRATIGAFHVGIIALTQGLTKAKVAVRALNIALKTNPWTLAASAIAAVVGGLWAYVEANKEATEAEEKRETLMQKLAKTQSEGQKRIGQAVGEVVAKYQVLQTEWKRLRTEQEKNKWLKANRDRFNELGASVWTVADAQAFLIDQAPAVINALKAVATADAYKELYQEAIKEKINDLQHGTVANGGYYHTVKPGTAYSVSNSAEIPDEFKQAGLKNGSDYTYKWTGVKGLSSGLLIPTDSGIKKLNNYRNRQALNLRNTLTKAYDDYIKILGHGYEQQLSIATSAQAAVKAFTGSNSAVGAVAAARGSSGGGSGHSGRGGSSGGGSHSGSNSGGGSGNDAPTADEIRNQKVKAAQDAAEIKRIEQFIKKDKGEINELQYAENIKTINIALYSELQKLYDANSLEYIKYEKQKIEETEKFNKQKEQLNREALDRELEKIEAEKTAEERAAKARYAQTGNQEQYDKDVNAAHEKALKKRTELYKKFNDPANEAEAAASLQELLNDKLIKAHKEYLERINKFRQEYAQKSEEELLDEAEAFAKELLNLEAITQKEFDAAIETINKRREEIKKQKKQEKEDKLSEEQKDKGYIKDPIGGATNEMGNAMVALTENLQNLFARLKDGETRWKDWAGAAVAAMTVASAAMSSFSSYYQASLDEETAKIEKKYDKEIEKAGSNSRRGKKLEEKKQKEIAAVKNKYNKKMQTIELAQAVASTAMAAINAYASAVKIPIIGNTLAPIAAGMALAAGALQIATIKKQHAAQSAGYYAGGFTGGSNYRREAGIVHQGEFVANHAAVNNPNVLPVLRLIDYAQRNNTVASLTAADVSRAVGANAMTATTIRNASAPVVIDSAQPRTAEALERLNDILAEPIKSYVTIDGNDGVAYNLNRYNKLKARK